VWPRIQTIKQASIDAFILTIWEHCNCLMELGPSGIRGCVAFSDVGSQYHTYATWAPGALIPSENQVTYERGFATGKNQTEIISLEFLKELV